MDDTALLETVREAEPATIETIARTLDADSDAIETRLAELESAGRVERHEGEWRLARDPRLDTSVERVTDRLGRERR